MHFSATVSYNHQKHTFHFEAIDIPSSGNSYGLEPAFEVSDDYGLSIILRYDPADMIYVSDRDIPPALLSLGDTWNYIIRCVSVMRADESMHQALQAAHPEQAEAY